MEVIAICNSCGSHLSSKHVRCKGFSEVRINTDQLVHFGGDFDLRGILFSTDFNDFFYYDCTFAKMMRFSTIHT